VPRYVYHIRGRSGSRSDWFHINRHSGLITTSVKFNCLTVGDYRLVVVAWGTTATVRPPRVVISTAVTVRVKSVNRHAPVFESGFYSVDVSEDTATSTCLLQVCYFDCCQAYTNLGQWTYFDCWYHTSKLISKELNWIIIRRLPVLKFWCALCKKCVPKLKGVRNKICFVF